MATKFHARVRQAVVVLGVFAQPSLPGVKLSIGEEYGVVDSTSSRRLQTLSMLASDAAGVVPDLLSPHPTFLVTTLQLTVSRRCCAVHCYQLSSSMRHQRMTVCCN